MKIKCSGELHNEPIEIEACLACAREKVAPPCGYSYPLIKAMSKVEERTGVHATAVIGCLLRAYYDMVDQEPKYLHEHLALWIGRAIHADIERALEDDDVQCEVPITYQGIEGRVDLIQGDDIIDIKTTRWMDPWRLPYGDHARQVSLYQKMTGLNGKLYIQYVDLTGPTRCKKCKKLMQLIDGHVECPDCGKGNASSHLGAKLMEIEPENTDEYVYRAEALKNAVATNVAPVGEPSWLCSYCDHVHKCPLGQIYLEAE